LKSKTLISAARGGKPLAESNNRCTNKNTTSNKELEQFTYLASHMIYKNLCTLIGSLIKEE
jgi:hypothetical protein